MAFDQALATRVRALLGTSHEITERQMFGGIAFMASGNMAVGVSKDELMVRIDPTDQEEALASPGVRAFDMTGRPMRGWILVASDVTADEAVLRRWVEAGLGYAASLPPK